MFQILDNYSVYFFKKNFLLKSVDLQYCVTFRCSTQQFSYTMFLDYIFCHPCALQFTYLNGIGFIWWIFSKQVFQVISVLWVVYWKGLRVGNPGFWSCLPPSSSMAVPLFYSISCWRKLISRNKNIWIQVCF